MARLKKKRPSDAEISKCALKCGQILGLASDINEDAMNYLIEDSEFRYWQEVKLIQELRRKMGVTK